MADAKKTGIKTTEFWLTLLANVLSLLYMAGLFATPSALGAGVALIATALANAGYTVSRGNVKAANASAGTPTNVAIATASDLTK